MHVDRACSGTKTTRTTQSSVCDAAGSDGAPESIFRRLEPVRRTNYDVCPGLTFLSGRCVHEPAFVSSQEEVQLQEKQEEEEKEEEKEVFRFRQRHGILLRPSASAE